MNPHLSEMRYVHYLDVKEYEGHKWFDTGMWVEVGGPALVICTISINTGMSANVGFRLVDENDEPLPPYRTSSNSRRAVHFSMEPNKISAEDLTPVTFHMVINCKYAKLQIFPDDGASDGSTPSDVRINSIGVGSNITDAVWSHKPISTISVLPLIPNYQGGANTIFTYPQSRTPRAPDDDKPDIIYKDKINPASSSGVPPQ